jgi:hypothetical protein
MPSLQAGTVERLVADPTGEGLSRHILEFDPKAPDQRVFTSAAITQALGVPGTVGAERFAAPAAVPALSPVPWPAGLAPAVRPIVPAPAPGDPLPAADVLIVTWTVAEAEALADLLTPGQPRSGWYTYAHGYQDYLPLIRPGAPARQYGRLGIYAVTQIGGLRVVCAQSDLHLSQDAAMDALFAVNSARIPADRPDLREIRLLDHGQQRHYHLGRHHRSPVGSRAARMIPGGPRPRRRRAVGLWPR